MADKRYNQFIQHQMRNEQPDKEKLISIASLIRREFGLTVQREAIFTFDKNDGHLVNFSCWLTEEQFKNHIIHVPDLIFFVKGRLVILEIDGYIHYVKHSVVIKDEVRDECYNKAKLHWYKIDELVVLLQLGKKPDRSATVQELWPEIKKIIKKII